MNTVLEAMRPVPKGAARAGSGGLHEGMVLAKTVVEVHEFRRPFPREVTQDLPTWLAGKPGRSNHAPARSKDCSAETIDFFLRHSQGHLTHPLKVAHAALTIESTANTTI
jgi:hypothetical protein